MYGLEAEDEDLVGAQQEQNDAEIDEADAWCVLLTAQ